MRNKLSVGIAFYLFVIVVSPSFAETSTSSSTLKTNYATSSSKLTDRKGPRTTAIKEEFMAAREEFKQKLSLIKDARKKDLVASMDARLNNINTNRTVHFGKVLVRLSELLAKVKDKTTIAKSEGLNTASVEEAIKNAETEIATAEEIVASQAAKDYSATISDESSLKQAMSSTISQLKKDLTEAHRLVLSAKKAVAKAVSELARLRGSQKTQ